MLKGLLLGILAGALAAAGAYRAFAWHRAPEAPATAPEPSQAEAKPAAESPALRALQDENAALRAELAALGKDAPAPAPTTARAAGTRARWKEIGAKVYRLRDQVKKGEEPSPEMMEVWTELMALLTEAATRDGVPIEEALLGPDGMLGFLLGVLAGAEPPPDAAQQARLEAIAGKTEQAWKEFLGKRGGETAMERSLDLVRLAGGAWTDVRGVLTPDQVALLEKLDMFDEVPRMTPRTRFSGDRASVAAQLSTAWQSALKLTDTQAASLGPVVDEWMRGMDDLEAAEIKDPWAKTLRETELMVAAQKRLKETLRLTPGQEEAMKEWNGAYGFEIATGR